MIWDLLQAIFYVVVFVTALAGLAGLIHSMRTRAILDEINHDVDTAQIPRLQAVPGLRTDPSAWDLRRAKNHYGVPCADRDCECIQRKA